MSDLGIYYFPDFPTKTSSLDVVEQSAVVVVVCMSLEKEAIFSSRMKLLLLSYIFFLGYIHFGNACCNVTERTNVLERAFGPVITSKLEDTYGDIKASFQSLLGHSQSIPFPISAQEGYHSKKQPHSKKTE